MDNDLKITVTLFLLFLVLPISVIILKDYYETRHEISVCFQGQLVPCAEAYGASYNDSGHQYALNVAFRKATGNWLPEDPRK